MNGVRTVGLALLFLGSLQSVIVGQTNRATPKDSPRLEWVDQLLGQPDEDGINGSVCAIVTADEILHLQGYGTQDRETKKPVDPATTRFYLASVTKLFTATLVWRLVDQELLNFQEDISVYLKRQPEISLLPAATGCSPPMLLTPANRFGKRMSTATSAASQFPTAS